MKDGGSEHYGHMNCRPIIDSFQVSFSIDFRISIKSRLRAPIFVGFVTLSERIRKPAFKNIAIFCFKGSQNRLELCCPMHISLKNRENKTP